MGHCCSLIALNDGYLKELKEESISTERGNITVLRLPSILSWRQRTEAATVFRNRFRPDWISLQFVPYGYHPKGIVAELESWLRRILGKNRMHIMFHELWLGGYMRPSWKEQIVGSMQRTAILRLIRRTDPAVVTTSNIAYRNMLEKHGTRTEVLRLFGNIPIVSDADSGWFEDEMRRTDVSGGDYARDKYWVFAFFGTLHREWPAEPLFSYLLEAAGRIGKKIVMASIGRLGIGETLWDELEIRYARKIHLVKLGDRPPERISAFLQFADFGIASSPWELVGKSGTAVSMLEHGLPVIVNRDEVHFAGFEDAAPTPGLVKMDSNMPVSLLSLERRRPAP
jgi:hypothetical protein